ncbi:hypothetical protein AB0D86_48080, partial [Streptomyces sp. NPDC048324]|uniref:hypothetical protein n=1 Tax=Streptomyces sp. NPDC048324 TaxID=3157205 RepID=UPI0034350BD1
MKTKVLKKIKTKLKLEKGKMKNGIKKRLKNFARAKGASDKGRADFVDEAHIDEVEGDEPLLPARVHR